MKIWADKKYYQEITRKEKFDHPGFITAQMYCQEAKKILDVGCGDGSKLQRLGGKTTKRFGCDVSPLAKDFGFTVFDGVHLPYQNESFDRVVSFFVLEHTQRPQELLTEMVRVLTKKGLLILLTPNFGAPNRVSPNYVGSRIQKLLFNPSWHKVQAKHVSMRNFESDLDTTMEPYLESLIKYLQNLHLKIIKTDSYWEMELPDTNVIQKIFRYLGHLGIYPFIYWGPHLFLVGEK